MTGPTQAGPACSRSDVLAQVAAAISRRTALHDATGLTAYRLLHGHGEGVPGLTIDRLGDSLVVTHREEHLPFLDDVFDLLRAEDPPVTRAVVKSRRGPGAVRLAWGEAPSSPPVVLDNGLRFEVDPLAPGNAGLYLDARPARGWLLEHSSARRVLNLFAYTGSLGLAAAAGEAKWVIHVEMQKRALRRLKRNFALNDLRIDDRDLVRADLYPYLRRLAREGRTFDGIILDPPPQVPGQGGARSPVGQDFPTLVRLAADVLAPGGWLLCFFSGYKRTRAAYEEEVRAASPHVLEVIWRGTSGVDFPEADPERKLRITAFSRQPD